MGLRYNLNLAVVLTIISML